MGPNEKSGQFYESLKIMPTKRLTKRLKKRPTRRMKKRLKKR